ncbi:MULTISPECIES: hypothetical protein [unclassified Nocardioides]|uniref:hypothetical protein n=1 Tax=unclassified Nocardioides TaxID=2615069 RepID=UPI0018D2A9E6|nr:MULTISPECIES: hypothetical protein [unclassified Nocardioides]
MAWQFAGTNHKAHEKVALKVIAFSFFGLAAFVTYDATSSPITGQAPEHSTLGFASAAPPLSLLMMPIASLIQRRTGTELGFSSAVADSKHTLLCT